MDNKLFTIFVPSGPEKGLRRFENGTRVSEFFDLRANPRCIIESQALDIRTMINVLKRAADDNEQKVDAEQDCKGAIEFNGQNPNRAISTWYSWGRAAGNEQMAEIYSHALGAPILADAAEVKKSVQTVNCNSANSDMASRASQGALFFAVYLMERMEKPDIQMHFTTTIEVLKRGKTTAESFSFSSSRRWKTLLSRVEENEVDDLQSFDYLKIKTKALDTIGDESALLRRRSASVTAYPDRLLIHLSAHRERSSSVTSSSALSQFTLPYQADSTSLVGTAFSSPQGPNYSYQQSNSPCCMASPTEDWEDLAQISRRHYSDELRNAIQIAEPDEDMWEFYAALLEEHIRLSEMVEEQIFHNFFNSI